MNRVPSISTFQAAKNLKHSGDELSQMQNRIRLLYQQDRRHMKKIEANQKCLQSLEEKKRRVREESEEKRQRSDEIEQNIRMLQDRNKILKDLRVERMNNIREDIYQNKRLECELTKNASGLIEKKIQAFKENNLNKNRGRRDFALLEKDRRKQNIKNKELERTGNIRNSTHQTVEALVEKKEVHVSELARLQKIEAQLVEKCKESSEISQNLKQEIDVKIGVGSRKVTRTPTSIRSCKAKLKQSADSFFKAQSNERVEGGF